MKTLSALSAAIYGIIYVRIPKKSRVTKRILGRKIFAAVIVVLHFTKKIPKIPRIF